MRYILSVLGVIVFIVVAIIIITDSNSNNIVQKSINVAHYNNSSSSVTFIKTGELVGNDSRQAVEISVSQSSRSIYILSGYNQVITKSESFSNIPQAYQAFLGALEDNNFAQKRTTDQANIFGICPLGTTYQYQLQENGNYISNLWATSCFSSDGNYDGYGSITNHLFALQIPNYAAFTGDDQYND